MRLDVSAGELELINDALSQRAASLGQAARHAGVNVSDSTREAWLGNARRHLELSFNLARQAAAAAAG